MLLTPHITTVEKHVEVPHSQIVEKVVEVPMVGDEIEGMQNHTHNHLPVQRQQHPAEVIHHHEVGMPFDTHYAGAGVYGGAVQMGATPVITQAGGSTMVMPFDTHYAGAGVYG